MKQSIVSRNFWLIAILVLFGLLVTSQVLAIDATAQTDTAVINTGALNVRSGPGVEYNVVTVVYQGATVTMLGRNSDSSWVRIRTSSNVEGWVNATYLTPSTPISSLPVLTAATATPTTTITPTATPTTTPVAPTATAVPPSGAHATVNTGALNVRSGPSVAYEPVTVIQQGTVVSLLGRNESSSWAKVRLSNGTEGWVNASLITPNVAISTLPVAAYTTPTATALVATGALNVRSGPGVTYSVLTVVSQGQTVSLLGRNANSSWAKIRTPNGTEGWVNASLLNPNVAISSLPFADSPAPPEPPVPVAPGATLSLRSGPGFNFQVTGTVYQGLAVNAIGRNSNNTWVLVRLSDGQEGWIGAQYVQLSIPIGNLPVRDGSTSPGTPSSGTAAATIATGALNVRSGPGIGYGVVAVANQGQTVTLLGRNSNSSWAKVRLATGTEGWVNAGYITPNVAINSLPVIDAPTLSSSGIVNTGALNVRSGPGISYAATAVVYQGQSVAMIGRNAASSWVKVRLANGHVGWVNAAYLQTNTTINSLPITN